MFLERLSAILEKETWIIDGNYGSTMELRMAACDTVIFLDSHIYVELPFFEFHGDDLEVLKYITNNMDMVHFYTTDEGLIKPPKSLKKSLNKDLKANEESSKKKTTNKHQGTDFFDRCLI